METIEAYYRPLETVDLSIPVWRLVSAKIPPLPTQLVMATMYAILSGRGRSAGRTPAYHWQCSEAQSWSSWNHRRYWGAVGQVKFYQRPQIEASWKVWLYRLTYEAILTRSNTSEVIAVDRKWLENHLERNGCNLTSTRPGPGDLCFSWDLKARLVQWYTI